MFQINVNNKKTILNSADKHLKDSNITKIHQLKFQRFQMNNSCQKYPIIVQPEVSKPTRLNRGVILHQNQDQYHHKRHPPRWTSVLFHRLDWQTCCSNHIPQPIPHHNISNEQQREGQQVKEQL